MTAPLAIPRDHGLSLAAYGLACYLLRHFEGAPQPGAELRVTLGVLAEKFGCSPGKVSKAARELAASGLFKVERSSGLGLVFKLRGSAESRVKGPAGPSVAGGHCPPATVVDRSGGGQG